MPCLLVEQGDGTIYHPRANTVNSRTMEFCRRWGVAEEVNQFRRAARFSARPSSICTSLQGYELARIERPTYGGGDKPLPLRRPSARSAATSSSSIRSCAGCAGELPERDACAIAAASNSFERERRRRRRQVRDLASGPAETIAARYLVACCGGRSTVPADARRQRWKAQAVLDYHLNVFLQSRICGTRHDKGKAAFYFFIDRAATTEPDRARRQRAVAARRRIGEESRDARATVDVRGVDRARYRPRHPVRDHLGPAAGLAASSSPTVPGAAGVPRRRCGASARAVGRVRHEHRAWAMPSISAGSSPPRSRAGAGPACSRATRPSAGRWRSAIVARGRATMSEAHDRSATLIAQSIDRRPEGAARAPPDRRGHRQRRAKSLHLRRHRARLSLRTSPIVMPDGTPPPRDSVMEYHPDQPAGLARAACLARARAGRPSISSAAASC